MPPFPMEQQHWQLRIAEKSLKKQEKIRAIHEFIEPMAGKTCLEVGCDKGVVLGVVPLQKIKELVFDEMVVKVFLSGLGEHGRRQVDTSQVTCQLAKGGTGQAGAAAEVEDVAKRETSLAMFVDQLR